MVRGREGEHSVFERERQGELALRAQHRGKQVNYEFPTAVTQAKEMTGSHVGERPLGQGNPRGSKEGTAVRGGR